MRYTLKQLPHWLLMLFALLLVFLIGGIDYLTGDYSLLIFYAVPISLTAWCVGRWQGAVVATAAGGARFVSDYFSYAESNFSQWNSVQDMAFLLLVGFLVSIIRALLSEEERRPG